MITDAILKINPNAKVVVRGDDKDINSNQIIWHEGTTPISKADIENKMAELKTAYDNAEYQRNRAKEYGTWQQQMEMIYKDQKNGTTTFKDHCDKVRSDNPKG